MIRQCPVCGKNFETGKHNKKLCSPECKKEQARRQKARFYTATYLQTRSRSEKVCSGAICSVCGKSFTPNFPNEHFCSNECRLQSPLYKILLGRFDAYGADLNLDSEV